MARLFERRANPNPNTLGIMNSGSDQRSRGRYNGNRSHQQQPQLTPQRNHFFDSNGPNIKIRGSPHQIFERYIALAREAAIGGDRVAAENFYQHAEHYLRVSSASREGNQPGTPRPNTPADAAISGTERGSSATDMERSPPGREDDQPGFI